MVRRLINYGLGVAVGTVRWFRKRVYGLGGVDVMIDRYWSDEHNMSAEGWVAADETIEAVELKADGKWHAAESLEPRADIAKALGKSEAASKGFVFQAQHGEPMHLELRVRRRGRWTKHSLSQAVPDCADNLDVPDGSRIFDAFVKEVNERHLHVLEIGSRIVSPGSTSKRSLFPDAGSYTGFDYYPDDNTDVTGDAHRLSEIVGERKFDAVFSIAVLEHLAMPWIVAREINRVLTDGGITYHGTVFGWPTHERPWDFWRLSDDGLRVLFSPVLGYEVLEAGMFDKVSMHFRAIRKGYAGFAHADSYASAAILARKRVDANLDALRWPSDLPEHLGSESHYPRDSFSVEP